MAQVLGESGRYVTDEAAQQSRRIFLTVVALVGVLALIAGIALASLIPARLLPPWFLWIVFIADAVAIWIIYKWGGRKLAALDKRRENLRRGATGETLVAHILANFPGDFHVINDLTTPFGNLDHVVVGPTGVFVLDSKN